MRFTSRKVHEELHASGVIGTLTGTLLHDPYRDREHHLQKIELYARWGAEELHAKGRRSGLTDRTIRPAWRFVRSYLFRGGFRDGALGWELSRLEAYGVRRKYEILAEMREKRTVTGER